MDAAALAVIWDERESVGCGELVVGEREVLEAEFVLYKIDETEGVLLGFLESLGTLLGCHFNDVEIVVIALNGPVYHIFSTGEPSVGNHHLLAPHSVGLGGVYAEVVHGTTGIEVGVIALGALYCGVGSVIFEDGNVGEVLDYAVFLERGNIFACVEAAFHAYIVFHARHFGNIAEFGGINHHARSDFIHARGAFHGGNPALPVATEGCNRRFALDA